MSTLEFFHNPRSRSVMTRALLEELDAVFELHPIDLRQQQQLTPDYLAINPMGKVPAIRHDGTVVTETVAIFIYLADRFPAAGLAPPVDAAARGAYLRWLVFYAACFEPAIGDRAMQRDPAPRAQSPYADYDTTINTVLAQLADGPWLTGADFTAADVLWGHALGFAVGFKLLEPTTVIEDYIKRVMARPAQQRAASADAALAAQMGLD